MGRVTVILPLQIEWFPAVVALPAPACFVILMAPSYRSFMRVMLCSSRAPFYILGLV